MVYSLTNFAATSSGIGALGFNGGDFLIQLITFILAYFVLKRYAFGPIIKFLDQRRQTIEEGVRLGEQMKREQEELEAKVEKTLHDTRVKADAIIASAQESGRQMVKEAEDKAKAKADGVLEAAEGRIAQETAAARQKLEKELVGLVADATEAVVKEKVDARKDAQLIERSLRESRV